MAELRAAYLTEEEIDAYYERKRQENLERYYSIQASRAMREDRGSLIRLIVVTVAALIVCTLFLRISFQVQQHTYRVSLLEMELNELRMQNDDAQKRLEDASNLQLVQERATELGMGYPAQGNVVYYSIGNHDYMYQTGEIPAD